MSHAGFAPGTNSEAIEGKCPPSWTKDSSSILLGPNLISGEAVKKVDVSKKRVPKTIVWAHSDADISFYQVWIYPYAKMAKGARVSFFQANKEKKALCYLYLEEDFVADPTSNKLGDTQLRRFYDGLCAIAEKALAKNGFFIEADYDLHIDAGPLTYEDFD